MGLPLVPRTPPAPPSRTTRYLVPAGRAAVTLSVLPLGERETAEPATTSSGVFRRLSVPEVRMLTVVPVRVEALIGALNVKTAWPRSSATTDVTFTPAER